jgi:hypothetical protein
MKTLVALASMAVLLCASASFAKQAMDEEEMDLITAAGQPSIIDIEVTTNGVGETSGSTDSSSAIASDLDTGTDGEASLGASTDPTSFSGSLGVGADVLLPISEVVGSAALNVNFSDADIETFTLSVVGSGSTGSLTATASASAESAVTGATASVTAMNDDSSSITLLVASGSQSELRALVLNNVVGENQMAAGINIRSGTASTGAEASQSNTITQSWGASYDWTFAEGGLLATTVAGAEATSTGGQGGTIGDVSKTNCILMSAACGTNDANGGAGGTATASQGAAAVGVLEHLPLTISADKISRVRVNATGHATVDVSEMDSSVISVVVDTGSQTNLAALVVNNVGGKNQIATGINVVSNGAVAIGNDAAVPLVIVDSTQNGSGSYGGGQSNVINQFRGTPYHQ